MEQPSDGTNAIVPSLTADGTFLAQATITGANNMSAMPPTIPPADGQLNPLQPSSGIASNVPTDGIVQAITAGRLDTHTLFTMC